MVATAMTEPKETERQKKEQTSLKVDLPEGELVAKLCALRRVTVAELFKMRDLNDFLMLLYAEELAKEHQKVDADRLLADAEKIRNPRKGKKG